MPTPRIWIAPPQDQRFSETFFLVEASSCEKLYLWKEWHKRVKWEEQSSGCFGQVGKLSGRPVVISVFWAKIDGRLIGFWESTSQVVDYKMIEKWFSKNCVPPKWDGTRHARCDAMNFHLCIQAIREANSSEPVVVG